MTVWGLRSGRTVVVGAALVAFALFCLAPLAAIVMSAFGAASTVGAPGLDLWLDVRQRSLLYNTVALGGATTLCATILGVPLGCVLARVPLRGKGMMRIMLAAPALFPPYVVALAWTFLAGRWLGEAAYSVGGAVAVLTVLFYPISMLATEVAVRRVEPRLEEAAALVATPMAVCRGITLPLIAPAV